jgi:hypothetical protein
MIGFHAAVWDRMNYFSKSSLMGSGALEYIWHGLNNSRVLSHTLDIYRCGRVWSVCGCRAAARSDTTRRAVSTLRATRRTTRPSRPAVRDHAAASGPERAWPLTAQTDVADRANALVNHIESNAGYFATNNVLVPFGGGAALRCRPPRAAPLTLAARRPPWSPGDFHYQTGMRACVLVACCARAHHHHRARAAAAVAASVMFTNMEALVTYINANYQGRVSISLATLPQVGPWPATAAAASPHRMRPPGAVL